ncbi:HK97 family phage prohead protease [Aeromonas salmonicida]|uniref:HK97 family phage prohead protease n=1 Tax=Aeromonas salmonicida TaxID=645 RepID=UPI003CFD1075
MKKLTANYQFKIKTFDAESGAIEGYAAVIDTMDWVGDIIDPAAFDACLATHKAKGTNIKMFWCHDEKDTIGVWHEAQVDEHGLYLKGQLTLEVAKAREVLALLKAGAVDGISIGFYTLDAEYDSDKGARIIKSTYVFEASLTACPAHPDARIVNVKSVLAQGDVPTERDLERSLRCMGFSQRQAKSFISEGYKGIANTAEKEPAEEPDLETINTVVEITPNVIPSPSAPQAELKGALSALLKLYNTK